MSNRTPLRIPSRVSIGKTRYSVSFIQDMKSLGLIWLDDAAIQIAVRSHKRRCSIEEQEETFLHEVVHGILNEMGTNLRREEKFVTEFAKLLHKALTTARY